MEYYIDVERLRRDMEENCVAAMFNGFPMAAADLSDVEQLSDYEVVRLAEKNGVDLRKYIV